MSVTVVVLLKKKSLLGAGASEQTHSPYANPPGTPGAFRRRSEKIHGSYPENKAAGRQGFISLQTQCHRCPWLILWIMQIKEVKEEHKTASSERYQSASELLKRAVPFPDSPWTPFRRRNWLARCEAAAGDRFATRLVDKANFLRVQQKVWCYLIPPVPYINQTNFRKTRSPPKQSRTWQRLLPGSG